MHGYSAPFGKKQKEDGNGHTGILRKLGQTHTHPGRAMAFAAVLLVMGLSFSTLPQRTAWFAERTTDSYHASAGRGLQGWDLSMGVAQEIQRDYCVRRYTGHAPREDMVKVIFQAPDAEAGYDFFVYKEGLKRSPGPFLLIFSHVHRLPPYSHSCLSTFFATHSAMLE